MHLPLRFSTSKIILNKPTIYIVGLISSSLIVFITLVVNILLTNTNNVLGSQSSSLNTAEVNALINLQRQANQLQPLQIDSQLNQAAQAKLQDMLTNNYFSHKSNRTDPWQFISATGYVYQHAGENLARDFYDNQTLVSAWMDSPTHRNNILNPNYTQTGIAISTDSANPVIVQLFATPLILENTPSPFQIYLKTTTDFIHTHQIPIIILTFSTISFAILFGHKLNTHKKSKTKRLKSNFWYQ